MAEKDLNIFLTGVVADGNPQASPAASLGGNRSGTILKSISASAPVNITGITAVDVSHPCGAGVATLTFVFAAKTISFAAPGDAAGAAINVAAGGTFELYSATAGKYMIVFVTAASLPVANATDTVTLAAVVENLFDSVSSGQAQAGRVQYRGLIVQNNSAYTMYGGIVWIASNTPFPDDQVDIGIEALGAGAMQSVANDTTAPTGITFFPAASEAAALSIGNIAAGGGYGIWVRRTVSPTMNRYADNNFVISVKADTV